MDAEQVQRCSDVLLMRWCKGAEELHQVHMCRSGTEVVQGRCRGRGAEAEAEVQRCGGAEVQTRWGGKEVVLR